MKNIYIHILSLLLLGIQFSCSDDPIYGTVDKQGSATIDLTMSFHPFKASELGTRTSGAAIKELNKLSVLIYKPGKEGQQEIVRIQHFNSGEFKTETNTEMPSDYQRDPSNVLPDDTFSQAEETTVRASAKLDPLPFGVYYIYAVGNVDPEELTEETAATPDMLKDMCFSWKSKDIADNNQMFGFFTYDTPQDRSSTYFSASRILLDKPNIRLHSWMKRLASKVSIVFDPSGLHEGIFIYINKVTVKDIPRQCYLGKDNTPSKKEDLEDGESIFYGENNAVVAPRPEADKNHSNWLLLSKGAGLQGAVEEKNGVEITHSETCESLFFYENMQGNKQNDPDKDSYDKTPDWDKVGTNVTEGDIENDWKDRIPYGSYIEVEGYYVSENHANMSEGPIKYRFMLGRDTKYDYNAERNMHYKLTLKFKGYANQPDWHIEYHENEPDAYIPELLYVPYLYNKLSYIPMRLTGNCISIKAQIVENNWAPYDEKTGTVPASSEVGTTDLAHKVLSFRWNKTVYDNAAGNYTYGLHSPSYYAEQYGIFNDEETQNGVTKKEYEYIYGSNAKITPIWAGFLSLTVPAAHENGEIRDLPNELFNDIRTSWYSSHNGTAGNGERAINGLREYFLGTYPSEAEAKDVHTPENKLPQHERFVDLSDQSDLHSGTLNAVTVVKNADRSTTVEFPVWTRPKAMIYISGFSGNNPYQVYMRKALIRFTFKFRLESGDIITRVKYLPVYQVRRVVNPKGIWRSGSKTEAFHVRLKHLEYAGAETFESIRSRGTWEAKITAESNPGHIYLSKMGGASGTITGSTGTRIEFFVNFKEKITDGTNACAVITIKYHGGTAEHTILVRHGFDNPIAIAQDGAKWSSYSVFDFDKDTPDKSTGTVHANLTVNPLALGSMFKRGNFKEGITISNNKIWGPLVSIERDSLHLTNGKRKLWKDIFGAIANPTSTTADNSWKWPDVEAGGVTYSVPSKQDFEDLIKYDVGYGVCYGDGAYSTAENINSAFSFFDDTNTHRSHENGMRGVFAFNPENGNNIFFPIGAFGMGRRTDQNCADSSEKGHLRYGSKSTVLQVDSENIWNEHRPIAYDNGHSMGAIYWTKGLEGNYIGWDMNYTDMNFHSYDYGMSKYGHGDAVPIKLVVKK